MQTIIVGFTLVAILAGATAQTASVRCYSCHNAPIQGYLAPGTASSDCGETFVSNGTNIQQSSGVMCMRVKYDDGTGNLRFMRTPTDVCVEANGRGLNIHCCYNNDCNHTTANRYSATTLIAAVTLSALKIFLS